TALSITHDMVSARKISDRIAMLYGGKIIWQGPTREIDHSGNPYVEQFIHGRAEGPIKMAGKALMAFLETVTFKGRHARLVPLSLDHLDGLTDAVRDGELWKLWYTSIPSPEGMRAEIERRLKLQDEGRMLPFTILDAEKRPVGMTTYMNI